FSVTGENALQPAISRTGRRLAYVRKMGRTDIWRLDLPREPDPSAVRQVRLSASTRVDRHPQFSPDGKKSAFGSSRSGYNSIWVANADGSAPVQVTSMEGQTHRWSPDGRRIAFTGSPDGNADI